LIRRFIIDLEDLFILEIGLIDFDSEDKHLHDEAMSSLLYMQK
jgi:hypothetical protein